jgi:hypothetical protein
MFDGERVGDVLARLGEFGVSRPLPSEDAQAFLAAHLIPA